MYIISLNMNTIGRELFLFFLYLLLTFIVATSAAWVVWNSQNENPTALYDVMFEILPDWSQIDFPVPNIVFLIQTIIVIVALKESKYKYICQMIFLNCTLLLLRSVTTSSTHMPNIKVYDYCKERPDNFFRVVQLMITHGTCSDYMYSGHTVTSFLLYLVTHTHATSYAYEVASGLFLGGTIFSLLVFRWHYTSDILIALAITWLLYNLYKENEAENDMWYYFTSLNKINWKCKRIGKQPRTDFSRSAQPVEKTTNSLTRGPASRWPKISRTAASPSSAPVPWHRQSAENTRGSPAETPSRTISSAETSWNSSRR